jgi:GT2 family glycosyltransferase
LTRPPISVVVPFGGRVAEADGVLSALGTLTRGPRDELILVDNTLDQTLGAHVGGRHGVRVLDAPLERSSYYARNLGALAAANEWLLFIDADCQPVRASLLDDYFATTPGDEVGAVAGPITGDPRQASLTARYSRERRYLDQSAAVNDPRQPFAATANLLVRKAAWASVGGFCEGIRSGGDRELCWRLRAAGWRLAYAEGAAVEHRHRTTLRALLRLRVRYGACAGWLVRHADADFLRPDLPYWMAREAAASAVHAVRGRWERAAFSLLDVGVLGAWAVGYALDNRPSASRHAHPPPDVVVIVDRFPQEDGAVRPDRVRELQRSGVAVRIEADARPEKPMPWTIRDLDVRYLEDDGLLETLVAALALRVRGRGSARSLAARMRRIARAGAIVLEGELPRPEAV